MKKTAIPSLLLSAVLLFYVQPFFGRLVLPFFGSSASVWTTCLAFFQIMLLIGYLYTHFLRRLKPKAQSMLHFVVLTLCTLLTLRLFDVSTFREAAAHASYSPSPVLSLLGLLFVWIGPAYFTLSTNSPLMQAWVGSVDTKQRKVYRLYALSNIGSFVGLFAYPIIVEPHLPISLQAPGFVVAFVVFAALTLASALQFFVRRPETKPIEALAKPSGRHEVIPPGFKTGGR